MAGIRCDGKEAEGMWQRRKPERLEAEETWCTVANSGAGGRKLRQAPRAQLVRKWGGLGPQAARS